MGMGVVVNHNLSAMNANRQMGINQSAMSKSLEKLSSGLKINRAADDASGLSISEKMRAQIRGLDQASSNAQDGISLIQTADGNLNETEDILQRIRELAVKGATGTLAEEDSEAVQDEVKALLEEVDRIGNTTEFNTKKLLDGSLKNSGTASVTMNTTTGADIAKLTHATASGNITATSNFKEEKIKIDGTEITVDWSKLTDDEKSVLKANPSTGKVNKDKLDLIVSKINEAIDEQGGKVGHISAYAVDAKGVITTAEAGIKSNLMGGGGLLDEVLGGTINKNGTAKYNGTVIATNSTAYIKIGDQQINAIKIGTQISGGTNMTAAASYLQNAINNSISSYNKTAGVTDNTMEGYIEKVTVNVTEDGSALVISSPTGAVELTDKNGKTIVSDLGLSTAQTSGAANGGMTLQIGANKGQTMTFGIDDMRTAALGIKGLDLSTQASSSNALDKLDTAIKKVSKQRSQLGASQVRLEHTIKNLDTSSENLSSAESRIRDTDMSKEMMNYTKLNILSQAAQSMLAQANQAPQGVLQLLQ